MDVNEIALQTQRTYPGQCRIDKGWDASEHTIEQEDRRDGQWDVQHSLHKERELAVAHLL